MSSTTPDIAELEQGEEAFGVYRPISAIRIGHGEDKIVDKDGNELWIMYGRALALWVCSVVNALPLLLTERTTLMAELERVRAGYPPYLSEMCRIVEGATRNDQRKVQSYVGLLIEKLIADGHQSTADRFQKIASGNAGAMIIPHEVSEFARLRIERDELSATAQELLTCLDAPKDVMTTPEGMTRYFHAIGALRAALESKESE